MRQAIVVVGLGELGSLFARGFLRLGRPVVPVTRELSMRDVALDTPEPELVLVAVAETELHAVLAELPEAWREKVGLLQNELLPRDWRAHGLADPTVAVVWFEKKPRTLVKELLPTVVHGPSQALFARALGELGIATAVAPSEDALVLELVEKNVFILVTNIAGLEVGGSVGALWERHRDLAERVMADVLALETELAGRPFARADVSARFEQAIAADPAHACTGRSALGRLARALAHADRARLAVPELRRIAKERLP